MRAEFDLRSATHFPSVEHLGVVNEFVHPQM